MALLFAAKKTRLERYIPLPKLPNLLPQAVLPQARRSRHAVGDNHSHGSTVLARVGYEVVHHVKGRIRLRIPQLAHDGAFAQRLERAIQGLEQVSQVRINTHACSLVVHYNPDYERNGAKQNRILRNDRATLEELVECLRAATGVAVVQDLATAPSPTAGDRINYTERLGLPILGLGLSAGVAAGLSIPGLLVGGAILAAATPIFQRTAQGIRDEKRLTVDFLDAATIVLLTAQASFLAPAFIVGVIEGSEVTRDWTARRTRRAEQKLVLAMEKPVLVERAGQRSHISMADVVAGDIVLVYPGDEIAVDGRVLAGQALVDQHRLTGDSAAVTRVPGDTVFATSQIVDGHLRILAQRTGRDTHIAATMAALARLPSPDTRISNHARKVGNGAVVPTLLVGGMVYATSGNLARLTGIVSLDLGTGMRVSAPIAVLTAQNNAARQGILIRSGRALELLAQVDTVVFDKTATLTQGRAGVVDVEVIHPAMDHVQLLALAASVEQELDHPVAHAIVRRAQEMQAELQSCTNWDYATGLGVTATVDGETVHVGNRLFIQELGLGGSLARRFPADDADAGALTAVYVARAGQLVGRLQCADPVRVESANVIERLGRMGITSLVVSGDSWSVSRAVAVDVGIAPEHVYGEILPQRKVDVVEALQADDRRVAVVGDGVNDVAAMDRADVSVALGSATALARETADIVLMNDDLRDLLLAVEIAQQSMRVIRQNRALVVAPNVGAIAYGALFVLNPVAGVVVNNGSALAAALNSLRPLRGPSKMVN